MFIKDLNLYINEKNIVTIQPYVSDFGDYGLCINGVKYKLGYDFDLNIPSRLSHDEFKRLENAVYGKMKALQTQLIKKVDKD